MYVQFAVSPGVGIDTTSLNSFLSTVTFAETRNDRDWYYAQMDTAELTGSARTGTWMTARIEGSPGFTGSDTDTDPNDPDPNGGQTRLLNDIFPDNLFTPGTHVSLFYKTRFVGGTPWFILPDTTDANYFTMEVLPSSFHQDESFNCVLYVDHFDGRGAEPYIKTALRNVLGTGGNNFDGDHFDTFNVRASSSQQASFGRPLQTEYGATVLQALGYKCIIWNSGNLGAFNLTKEDADVLTPWLTLTDFDYNTLYLSGDGLVSSAFTEPAEASARDLLEDLAGVTFSCSTYRDIDCPVSKPVDDTACVDLDPVSGAKVAGSLGRGVADHQGQGNGCPDRRSFDVLGVNPSPEFGVATPDEIYNTATATSGPSDYASVAIDAADADGLNYRIVTDGVSLHHRRDTSGCTIVGTADPVTERLEEVLTFLGYADPALCAAPVGGAVGPTEPVPPAFKTALQHFAPNPLRAGDTGQIRFTLEREGKASVTIFDVNGRVVNLAFEGIAAEGINEISWNGTDTTGRRVASGVYFFRLRTLGKDFSKKLVVLRNGGN